MTRIVCVGDVMLDVHAALPGPLALGSDVPGTVTVQHGGAAANVAAWAAHLGADVTFVGRVGDDVLGREAAARLTDAGVAVRVEVDPTRPTGTCIVLVGPDGERTMIPSAGANDAPVHLDALPADADWLYLSGYTVLREGTHDVALQMLAIAHERGWSVAVDAASAGPLTTFGAQAFLDSIGTGITVFANLDEAAVLTASPDPDPASAAQALALTCGQAVVKRGSAGAVWSDASGVRSVPAAAAPVLDTTGAGDAFAAGYLVGGPEITDRLSVATTAAAQAVGLLGARPAGPSG